MFREWGFLLSEIWGLLALAALIGLIAGWLFWGRRTEVQIDTSEADRLRAELEKCRADAKAHTSRIGQLESDLESCRSAGRVHQDRIAELEAQLGARSAARLMSDTGDQDYDGDGVIEGKDEGTRPAALDAPRGGKPDDLKKIKGIGPKLEKLCNKLGFWHFDQIAAWTDQEIAWVDANLEGFKGRVTRDRWVEQAKLLAAGEETEFSKRVDKGDVY